MRRKKILHEPFDLIYLGSEQGIDIAYWYVCVCVCVCVCVLSPPCHSSLLASHRNEWKSKTKQKTNKQMKNIYKSN